MGTVTPRFIKTFLLFSVLSLILTFVVRLFFLSNFANFGTYESVAVFLSVLLTYTIYFPYILSFSLHRAFFCYREESENAVKYISQKTIIIASILLILYTLMLVFFSSKVLTGIYNLYLSERYTDLFESRDNKSKEFVQNARDAYSKGDYDRAIDIIEGGLLILPEDNNLILLLRDIREAKSNANLLRKGNSDNQLEAQYMINAIKGYSSANYGEAKQYFYKILDINSENGLAKYYLNKIAIELGESNDLFNKKDDEQIALYDRISEGISLYENGYYWEAYHIFRSIYLKYPNNFEVLDYYNLAISKIKINDFFIKDASFLYDTFVQDIKVPTTVDLTKDHGIFDILNFPINYASTSVLEFLKLNDNDYLYSTVLEVFDEIYFFDTVLFSITNTNTYKKYRFGKLVQDNYDKNKYSLILKGEYFDGSEYNDNNLDYNNSIIFTIDPQVFNITKNIDAMEFVSIIDVAIFLKYMPDFGFDKSRITYLFMYKLFLPLIVILISVVISYYSIRYRAKKKLHLFHNIVGFFGCIFITFILLKILNSVINTLSIISSGSYIPFVILAILLLLVIFIYSVQFFRVKLND